MKITKIAFAVLLFVAFLHPLMAQTQQVTGTVTDESGSPLPGVSVVVKNTVRGTSTDFDGKYALEAASGEILEFSYVGYATQERTVGAAPSISVTMREDTQQLGEVVVTALGIRRQEKTLTYAQQKVDAEEITKTKDINFANTLSGKTAGLQLNRSGSGAGGSTRIVLRGNKSIVGVSSPLYVIDGVPVSSETPNANSDSFFESRDRSDALSLINPDDIESVTVLKGSNAAILYGSQGANGVIMITTKKGKEGKLSGSFSSSLVMESVLELPDLQYQFGTTVAGSDENWSTTAGNYNDSFVKDFFNTGYTTVNSVSLSGGNQNSTTYFSYSNTSAKGVIPNNEYVRHNVTINQQNRFLNDKLNISAKIMLTDEQIDNKPAMGYYFNPLTGLYWFPRNLDMNEYRNDYQVLDPSRNIMTQHWHIYNVDNQQNPYWVINKNTNSYNQKRMLANINLGYQLTEHLNFQVRGNYDYMPSVYERRVMAGTTSVLSHANGRWNYINTLSTQMYTDAILTYQNQFGKFDLNVIAGTSYEKKNINDGISVDSEVSQGLKYANEFMFQNLNDLVLVQNVLDSRSTKQSVFGNVQLGYQDMLYLDISGRNDWASTLAFTSNYSYFYPSFGLTALLNNMFQMPEYVTLAKLRASYSSIANEVPAFITNPLSSIGRNSINANTTRPFTELKPEKQQSFEIGADLRFFANRLGVDFTYYKIDTKDQYLDLTAPSGSGYTRYYVNAGHIRNQGIELSVNAIPLRTTDWTWNSTVNYSFNRNKIIALHADLQGRYQLNDTEGYALYITEGGSFGDIYAYQFERDAQGRILIENGRPVRTNNKGYVGNSQPKFLLGWNNSVAYKNWTLSFLVDGKFGGEAVSLTESILDFKGVSSASAEARFNGGVTVNGADASGNAITTVGAEDYYKAVGGRDGIIENYVYDATNVRLRQAALAYDFDLSGKSSFFSNLNVSLIANNLFFIYKKAPFDPDLLMSTGNRMQGVDLFGVPSTRTYGLNVKLNF
ncbi:MAG: SusC/RagA family TonB-linked outer membrane protein [Capnocytophaga sp.]|nr:SusC/RagA family TonB-linked outer membrane protein [Capnocytophaga sp.]